MTVSAEENIKIARDYLRSHGYVVLLEKSYRRAQERQHIAEHLREYADHANLGTQRWAQGLCDEIRSLRDRVTFLYGAAIAAGATQQELSGTGGAVEDQLDELDALDEQEVN